MPSPLRLCLATVAAAVIGVAVATPAVAGGVVDPAPIGPNTAFIGEVNNTTSPAVIHMACFGPTIPGQTGHPMANQTVKALPVVPPVSSLPGYTGSAATSIVVTFNASASAGTPVVLHDWAVSALIPTTLILPCSGTGQVTFTPQPTSATARSAVVTVTFVGQP